MKTIVFIVFEVSPLSVFCLSSVLSFLFHLVRFLCGREKLDKVGLFLQRFAFVHNYLDKSIPQKYFYRIILTKVEIISTTPWKCQTLKEIFLTSSPFRLCDIKKEYSLKSNLFRWRDIENEHFSKSHFFGWCAMMKMHFFKSAHFRWCGRK